MSDAIMPFFWVAFAMIILLVMQRWIHTHLHGLSLLLMGKPERAVILYAIVLLPGVFLHELSHWLTATFLGVRTGTFSVIPKMQSDGTVQLGYVEYFKGTHPGAYPRKYNWRSAADCGNGRYPADRISRFWRHRAGCGCPAEAKLKRFR